MDRVLRRLRRPWNSRISALVAVTTLLLAGCATLATFQAAAYGNDALLAQTELANCWSYYQAKSIKQHIFQLHRDLLLVLPATDSADLISHYDDEIERYNKEKHVLMQKATALSHTQEKAQQHASSFGESLIFLQVGILFSSLASVNRITYYWYGAILSALFGLGMLIFALFVR